MTEVNVNTHYIRLVAFWSARQLSKESIPPSLPARSDPAFVSPFGSILRYLCPLFIVFAPSYREKTWVLKRVYSDETREREKYENGMAASYVKLLLSGDRAVEWSTETELEQAVSKIP